MTIDDLESPIISSFALAIFIVRQGSKRALGTISLDILPGRHMSRSEIV